MAKVVSEGESAGGSGVQVCVSLFLLRCAHISLCCYRLCLFAKRFCMLSQPGSPEWEYQYRNIVFGQLGSYALNMKASALKCYDVAFDEDCACNYPGVQTFGLPPEKVSRIVTHLAVGNRLPRDMLQVTYAIVDVSLSMC